MKFEKNLQKYFAYKDFLITVTEIRHISKDYKIILYLFISSNTMLLFDEIVVGIQTTILSMIDKFNIPQKHCSTIVSQKSANKVSIEIRALEISTKAI